MLTESERMMLMAVLRHEEALAASPPIPAYLLKYDVIAQEEFKYGPRYVPSEWFGELTNAARQRLLRAAHALAKRDLLVGTALEGGRLSYLKLTDAGRELARQLLVDETTRATEANVID